MDDIEKRVRFDKIRYANCWEDAEILCRALLPMEGKRILSIASAGDNAFALLSHGSKVVAADVSQAQMACVELRKEIIRTLEYEEVLCFLGVKKSTNRIHTYRSIRKALYPATRQFWDHHPRLIAKGIIHSGKFERYFKIFRRVILPLIHSKKTIRELIQTRDRERRHQFYHDTWANLRWHLLFRVFFSRFVMGNMGRDPEFFRYVEGPVSERILERTRHALTELPTHENPYLDYILNGNFRHCLPYYLREDRVRKIRENIVNLKLVHGSIQDTAVHHCGDGFDGYNLSDIFEYIDVETCRNVYEKLLRHANQGARLAYWNMLAPRQRPNGMASRIRSLDSLSRDLFQRDKAFFYSRFVVEEVQ